MNKKSKLTFGKIFERFSYGCGDFGCNIIYTAMSAFLLFYYTDYAQVNAMAVGTIMMVSRFFDGISDIIMGVIVDRTKSKFGKARPWLLRMCIPFAVSGVLLFSVPTSWASSTLPLGTTPGWNWAVTACTQSAPLWTPRWTRAPHWLRCRRTPLPGCCCPWASLLPPTCRRWHRISR